MCIIYYPFFKIEKDIKIKYDHKRDLLVLLLVSDKILLASKHLIDIEDDKFDILLRYKKMFQKNIIYSRCSEDYSSMLNYFESKKNNLSS